jgi:hypothetical protein
MEAIMAFIIGTLNWLNLKICKHGPHGTLLAELRLGCIYPYLNLYGL